MRSSASESVSTSILAMRSPFFTVVVLSVIMNVMIPVASDWIWNDCLGWMSQGMFLSVSSDAWGNEFQSQMISGSCSSIVTVVSVLFLSQLAKAKVERMMSVLESWFMVMR